MFDAQAWFVRDVMLGRIVPPAKSDMHKHSQEWRTREEALETGEEMIYFQGDYVQDLVNDTDYPNFDVEGVNKTFVQWEHDKHDDIMGFRNNSCHSLMTGNMQPKHHTPWVDELDDSMEAYLKDLIPRGSG